jgi:hypothetical protein
LNNNIFSRFFNRRPSNVTDDLPIESIRATSLYSLRTMKHYASDDYENGYSSIRAIANRFMLITPSAIDANGKPMENTPAALNCLSRPNSDMSGIDFRDALAVMTMVHRKVYILVWEKNGAQAPVPARENVSEDRIAGFTFLENVVEQNVGLGLQYQVMVATENGGSTPVIYYPYQVITLHDTNPTALSEGYSPANASKRWTRIDDYIADYQSGFFENGAVPAGQFVITAPTSKEYEDIVDKLQEKHRGAGKNNNVVYSYQPIDPKTGAAGQATITWIPFNTTNKDMSLDTLFKQANQKIDSVYGVSAFIRAIDEAPNFATAQVIERNFVENTVRPFAIKKWARIQHELNRITGGLGYGITFKLETPSVAEENKYIAETNAITATTINTLTTFGYTLESVIDAMLLPPNWKLLKKGEATTTTIDNDKSDVDEGGEVGGSPGNGGSKRTRLKASNQLSQEDIDNYANQLREPARVLMDKQVERAVSELDPSDAADATDDEKDTFVDEMMAIIAGILLVGGITEWEAAKTMLREAGITPPSTTYSLTDEALTRYRQYLYTVANSYSSDTTDAIRKVLEKANDEAYTKGETQKALRNVMNTDEWRVTRLARTEATRSGSLSSIESMIALEDEVAELTIEKSLESSSGDPCEFCQVYIGTWRPVKSIMVTKGQIINGVDGGIMVNNWDINYGHDVHANGECYPIYRVT